MLRALKEAGWTWSDATLSTVVADLSREGIDDPNALHGEGPFACHCAIATAFSFQVAKSTMLRATLLGQKRLATS